MYPQNVSFVADMFYVFKMFCVLCNSRFSKLSIEFIIVNQTPLNQPNGLQSNKHLPIFGQNVKREVV